MSNEMILKFTIPKQIGTYETSAETMFRSENIVLNTEDQLFLEYIEGNNESFNELFKMTRPWLFTMAYRILGDRSAAEDVLQETWIKMINQSDTYNPSRGKICNYIFTIAKNFALQSKRRTVKLVTFDEREEVSIDLNDEIHVQELCAMIQEIISNFKNQDHMNAVLMYYYADLGIKDIAKKMNTNEQNVKNWLSRGRKKIEKELRDHKDYSSIHDTMMSIFRLAIVSILYGKVL